MGIPTEGGDLTDWRLQIWCAAATPRAYVYHSFTHGEAPMTCVGVTSSQIYINDVAFILIHQLASEQRGRILKIGKDRWTFLLSEKSLNHRSIWHKEINS